MARNATVALTDAQVATVNSWNVALVAMVGERVTLDFIKRDGTPSTITGTLLDVMGATHDKRVAVVDTDKGPRSANLWTMTGGLPVW